VRAAVRASAYRIPTDAPEADGTFAWHSTTLVGVEVDAGGATGLGYTYTDEAAAGLTSGMLARATAGADALATTDRWAAMVRAVRNIGRTGLAATAVSAVDAALWDLKGKLLGVPVVRLLGAARDAVPIYGSGGFTSYSDEQLAAQLGGWAEEGLRWVKMKIGTEPERDLNRVRVARRAVGEATGGDPARGQGLADRRVRRRDALRGGAAHGRGGRQNGAALWTTPPTSSSRMAARSRASTATGSRAPSYCRRCSAPSSWRHSASSRRSVRNSVAYARICGISRIVSNLKAEWTMAAANKTPAAAKKPAAKKPAAAKKAPARKAAPAKKPATKSTTKTAAKKMATRKK
jgi:hypothetical protein